MQVVSLKFYINPIWLEFLNNGEDNRIRLSYSTENIYGSLKYMLFLVKDLIVA